MLLKKTLFLPLVIGIFFCSGLNAAVEIAPSHLFIPNSLDGIRLFHDKGAFIIVKDGEELPVSVECIDKELRGLSDEDLEFTLGLRANVKLNGKEHLLIMLSPEEAREFLQDAPELSPLTSKEIKSLVPQLPTGSYIKVFQYEDGSLGLHLKTRMHGGGFGGAVAGFFAGKVTVHLVGQGIIYGIAGATQLVAPGSFPLVLAALEGALATPIEVISNKVACTTAVMGMLATGPA